MRTFDFTPFYRSTVGYERLFDMLDATQSRSDWPPYNIERSGDDRYRITMAVAGFAPSEIELTQHGNVLTVAGGKKTEKDPKDMLHQGIAFRNFRQTFNLADHVKVVSADIDNGLLFIDLVQEVPEQLKPRRIDIGKPPLSAAPAQDNQPRQIESGQGKAA